MTRTLVRGSTPIRRTAAPPVAPAEDLRSFVTFVRDDPADCGQRQVYVRIDGDRLLRIVFGESVEVEFAPGLHRFRIHNTLFWKNIRLAIEPGERIRCRIINSARWWTAGFVGVLGAAPLFLSVKLSAQ